MNIYYPVLETPATPEYILAVLMDCHRHQAEFDPEADPDAKLSLETTIAKWRDACDLVAWRPLGHALNQQFSLNFSDKAWHGVLEPAKKRTLYDVCELISIKAKQWRVTPAHYFGQECLAAGVFRSIRSLLADEGVPVTNVKPSTLLAPYLRERPALFIYELARIAPGALPRVRIRNSVCFNVALALCGGGWLLMIFFQHFGACLQAAISICLFAAGYCTAWLAARFMRPRSVTFGSLTTFADLSRTISASVGGHRSLRSNP